jgi:hypothetical protein
MNRLKTAAAAAVLSAAVLAADLAAMATAIPSNTVALRTAVADDVTLAQVTRSARQRALGPENYAAAAGPARPDTIGSLGYDGRGYGYNRFSGQVYQSCVEDLGYGRVRPCDAGSH